MAGSRNSPARFLSFGRHATSLGRSLAFILVLFVLLCLSPATAWAETSEGTRTNEASEPYVLPSHSEGSFFVEMLGQIEVLTAIQSQTTWMETLGPRDGTGNDYFRAVREFMSRYRDHEAVKVCQELLDRGFSYDAPVRTVLHWGPLPDLELVHEYDEYLLERAGGREYLERFRLAARQFVRDSNFIALLEEWRPKFESWVSRAVAEARVRETQEWLEKFFGVESQEFHLVLSPASFYGGYGPKMPAAGGGFVAFCVAPAYPDGPDPRFGDLIGLCLHEFGHSFVNPPVMEFLDATDVQAFEPLFRGVRDKMERQAYGDTRIILAEQVLRATSCVVIKEFEGVDRYERCIAYEQSRGFYLTRYIAEKLLNEYVPNRNIYPTFREYVPVLFRDLQARARKAEVNRILTYRILAPSLGLALAIGGAVILRRLKRKRTGNLIDHPRQ